MDRRLGRAVAFLFVFLIAGCANTPVERQEATSRSLVDLEKAMVATRTQIDQTLTSLQSLMRAPEEQRREAFRQFDRDVGTIARQSDRMAQESRDMKRRSETWLSAWKEIYGDVKNPELRTATEARREQVLLRFHTLQGSLANAHQALAPFITNLQDVRKVMGYDLSSRGVAAVSSTSAVPQAEENGKVAARAIDVAINDLNSLLAVLAPVAPR